MEPETDTLLSDDVEDCLLDSNVFLTAEEMEREYMKVLEETDEDDAADEDCATDVESETPGVATIDENNDDENVEDTNEDNSCEEGRENNGTVDAPICKEETKVASKSRNGIPKPPKKFSPFRHNQHFGSSNSIIDGAMPSKGSKQTSSFYDGTTGSSSGETSEEGNVTKKDRSKYTFNKATFVYKSPYGLYNIQIKRKVEPSQRPKILINSGFGFNKSSFNYISPYGEMYMMSNGRMEGVGRRVTTLPVFNKRLFLNEKEGIVKMVRKDAEEQDDFCLDDFNDENYEVVISTHKDEVGMDRLYRMVPDDVTSVQNPGRSPSKPGRDHLSDSGSIDTGRGEEIRSDNCSVDEVEFARSLKKKIFTAFDGDTIAAMDPETFADYLGSQSMLDMMEGDEAPFPPILQR